MRKDGDWGCVPKGRLAADLFAGDVLELMDEVGQLDVRRIKIVRKIKIVQWVNMEDRYEHRDKSL